MSIKIQQTGNFNKLSKYLGKLTKVVTKQLLDKYGQMGVDALAEATPVDTGLTASSWYYDTFLDYRRGLYRLSFWNSNVNDGVPIAIILQYGHGTGTGGWVEGIDYINPALTPVFKKLSKELWEEVKSK